MQDLRAYAAVPQAAADRPPREFEGIQGQANTIAAGLLQAAERLRGLNSRLLGEANETLEKSGGEPQPVRAEIYELAHTLSTAQRRLDEVMSAIDRLESI